MYKQEQIKPYEGTGDKGKLVEEMFDNIAPTYDTLNHRLSWDIDKGWRKKAIRRLAPFSPKKMRYLPALAQCHRVSWERPHSPSPASAMPQPSASTGSAASSVALP